MADKISFDLVSPERLLLSDEADMVTVPATEGYMGVMAGHAPVDPPTALSDLAVLDQRIRDAEENVIAAKSDTEKQRASETLDDLKQVRAIF